MVFLHWFHWSILSWSTQCATSVCVISVVKLCCKGQIEQPVAFFHSWRTLLSPAGCPALSLLSLTEPLCRVPSLSLCTLGTGSTLPKNEHALWEKPVLRGDIKEMRHHPALFKSRGKEWRRHTKASIQRWVIFPCVCQFQICYCLAELTLSVVVLSFSFLFSFCAAHKVIFFLVLQIPPVFLQVPMLIIFSEGSALLPLTWCRSLHSKMCTKSLFTQLCRYWCLLHFTSDVQICMCRVYLSCLMFSRVFHSYLV